MDHDKKSGFRTLLLSVLMSSYGPVILGLGLRVGHSSTQIADFTTNNEDKGNVIPALVIALLGVVANGIFWRRYSALYRRQGNAILGVQARLYGAKTAVDTCVVTALTAVLIFPGTETAYWLDRIGSLLVAVYMIRCGIRTIREQKVPAD